MRIFFIAVLIAFGWTSAQPNNEMDEEAVSGGAPDPSQIKENFVNLFDSIRENNAWKAKTYRDFLEEKTLRGREAFDTIKDDLRLARQRKAQKSKSTAGNDGPNSEKRAALKRQISQPEPSTGKEQPSHDVIPESERNVNYKGMVRDLTNLRLDSFMGMVCSSLSKPLYGANESAYLFCITEYLRFGQVGDNIMPAVPGGNNLMLTTRLGYYIFEITVNQTARAALALMNEYKSRFFNDNREVLCLGINFEYIGSSRVSLQDRIVCSWVAELYHPNGTLKRTFEEKEDVYKRFATGSDKRDNYQKLRREPVAAFYDIMEMVGTGDHTSVYACRERRTGKRYAAKYKFIHYPAHVTKEQIFIEVDIMRLLDHPNLIRLHEAFETDEEVIMIIDLMNGPSLGERQSEVGRNITEQYAVNIVKQIVAGIKYMHENGFVHFDLHPGNIMCDTEACEHIKIIDFSKAGRLDTITLDYEKGYLARRNFSRPEYKEGKRVGLYTDTWSLGIVTYFLICGMYPFKTIHDTEMPKIIDTSRLFRESAFYVVTDQCRDFLKRLLVEDRSKRMTIQQCAEHPWLTEELTTKPSFFNV